MINAIFYVNSNSKNYRKYVSLQQFTKLFVKAVCMCVATVVHCVGTREHVALLDTLQSYLAWQEGEEKEKPLITVKSSVGFGPLTAHYWFPCFKSDNEWLNVGYIYLHGNRNWTGYHSLIRIRVIKLSSGSSAAISELKICRIY
jgi:hypothetical protein